MGNRRNRCIALIKMLQASLADDTTTINLIAKQSIFDILTRLSGQP